jgi:uncharacterized membrane protein
VPLAAGTSNGEAGGSESAGPTSRNIQDVIDLERRTRLERTALDRITDRVTSAVSSAGFIIVHVLGFTIWIGLNTLSPRHFDPFPFNFLTLVVSLEAIVLTGFVLMSQSRMTQLADKRAHLDLQVNLLAEQELTSILRVVCLVADKAGIDVARSDPRLQQLLAKTDVKRLSDDISRELATVEGGSAPLSRAPSSTSPDGGQRPCR